MSTTAPTIPQSLRCIYGGARHKSLELECLSREDGIDAVKLLRMRRIEVSITLNPIDRVDR